MGQFNVVAASGQTLTVALTQSGSAASVFSDPQLTNHLGSPTVSSDVGYPDLEAFYAANGTYEISIYSGGNLMYSSALVLSSTPVTLGPFSSPTGAYVAPSDPRLTQFNPMQPAYGAVGDAMLLTDVTMVSGHGYVTSTSYTFTSANIGQYIAVQGAGAAGADFTPVLINGVYTDGVSATTSGVTAGTSVTNARCMFGHDDSAAIQAAEAAVAANDGGELEITSPHLVLGTTNSSGGVLWAVGITSSRTKVVFKGHGKIFQPKPSGTVFFVSGAGKNNALTSWNTNRYIDATQYAINLPITAGAVSVTCTTAANAGNFQQGDYLYLFTGDITSGATGWYGIDSETFQVVSANASTGVITLNRPAGKPYAQEYWPTVSENTPTTTTVTAYPAPVGIAKVTDRTIGGVHIVDFDCETWSLDRNAITSWQVEDLQLIRPKGRGYCGLATGRDRISPKFQSPQWHSCGPAASIGMGYWNCWASGDTDWVETDAVYTSDNYAGYLHCHEGGVRCKSVRGSYLSATTTIATSSSGSGAGIHFAARWYNCLIDHPVFGQCVYGMITDNTGQPDQLVVEEPHFTVAPTTSAISTGVGIILKTGDMGVGPFNLNAESAGGIGSDRGRGQLYRLGCDITSATTTRSLTPLPQGATIQFISIVGYSQFNGSPTLSIGISGDAARYMGSFTVPTTAVLTEGSPWAFGMPGFGSVPIGTGSSPGVIPPSRAVPFVTFTAGGATQGKLRLSIVYSLDGASA